MVRKERGSIVLSQGWGGGDELEVVRTSVRDVCERAYAWRFDVMWHVSVRIRESAPLPAVAASSCCTGKFWGILNSAQLPRKRAEALFFCLGRCMAVAQGDDGWNTFKCIGIQSARAPRSGRCKVTVFYSVFWRCEPTHTPSKKTS